MPPRMAAMNKTKKNEKSGQPGLIPERCVMYQVCILPAATRKKGFVYICFMDFSVRGGTVRPDHFQWFLNKFTLANSTLQSNKEMVKLVPERSDVSISRGAQKKNVRCIFCPKPN